MKSRAGALRTGVEHIVYIFDGFRLDAGRRQLSSSGGVVVPLNSRAMEALVMLVSRAGELVTKKQLLEGVWPSAVVEDNNINQCVLAIRKALGESAGSNRFIMTVPGRGYRFVAPVTLQRRESAELSEPPAKPPGNASRWMQLVLPGSLAAVTLVLLTLAASRTNPPHQLAAQPSELVVHLRRDREARGPGAETLLACLRQRPDLHLQVDVHMVGSESTQPVWTSHYMAGAQDLLPDAADHASPADACRQLVAK